MKATITPDVVSREVTMPEENGTGPAAGGSVPG